MVPIPFGFIRGGVKTKLGLGARFRVLLPLLPLGIFTILFLIMPAFIILFGSFFTLSGNFTFKNFARLLQPNILSSFLVTIQLSAVSSIGGAVIGFFLAYAVHGGGLPRQYRSFLLSFSGVASNFAGVPLAFAFISTLGRMGLVTLLLKEVLGIDLYGSGFTLYSFWGLCFTYLYFQIPLMILVISPSVESLRREWREAAQSVGASTFRFWVEIALPILFPSLLSATLLLFGNAFGAYATAYALTGGMLNLVTILIGSQIRGDVLHDPNLGYALATGMVLIMTLTTVLANILKKRASQWNV